MKSTGHPSILIVGGGIAGLATAEALLRRFSGRPQPPITILESRGVPGGRAGSFRERSSSAVLANEHEQPESIETDYCQHVTMGCCTNLLALLTRTELIHDWTRYRELTFYHPDHGRMPFRPSAYLPPPLHLHGALSGLRFLSRSQQREVRTALWALMRTDSSSLIDITAEDWLCEHQQSSVTRRCFWDVILISALGDVCDRVSMAAARKVLIDGFASSRNAGDVWVPHRPLSEIFGRSLPSWLTRKGVTIRTGVRVRGLDCQAASDEVTLQLSGGDHLGAAAVVLATPWHVTQRLLSTTHLLDESSGLFDLESSPITGIHLWLDRPLTDLPHMVMVGTVAQWLFREPLVASKASSEDDRSHYHQVVISGRHAMSDASKSELVAHVLSELNAAFPEAGGAMCWRSRVVTDPHSVFSVSPESYRRRPGPRTRDSRIVVAGDAVQTGWPATMESAVISGAMAAAALLAEPSPLAASSQNGGIVPPLRPSWLSRCLIRS